jgi:hypothetical protein
MLLIACGIDANDKVVPIAWALVPIENEAWWMWRRYVAHVHRYRDRGADAQFGVETTESGLAPAKVGPWLASESLLLLELPPVSSPSLLSLVFS